MPPEKKKWFTRKRVIWLIILLLIGAFFYRNTILATVYSFVDRWHLPHYAESEKISETQFNNLQSDVKITKDYREIGVMPGVGQKLIQAGLFREDLPEYYKMLIYDKLKNTYYYHDTLSFELDHTRIYKIEPHTVEPETHTFPFDDRWKATGGLSCFSCGCSCYMDKDLVISNGQHYINVHGENFAIRSDRQGIYYLQPNNTWLKLTPKVDGDIKITNGGCVVSYHVGSRAYSLNACES